MDQTPINFNQPAQGGVLPGSGRPLFGQGSASLMSMRWAALHDAADTVARIAGLGVEPMPAAIRNFPSVMRDAGGWRHDLAEQGVTDLSALMVPGLSALLQAHARGADTRPAAVALWQEFVMARDALLALQPPETPAPPRRFA